MSLCDNAATLFDLCREVLACSSCQTAIEYFYLKDSEITKMQISYKDLAKCVNMLSEILSGVEDIDVIGIHLEPSIELVTSILSSLNTRIPFIPIQKNPNSTVLGKILSLTGMRYILSRSEQIIHIQEALKKLGYQMAAIKEVHILFGGVNLVRIKSSFGISVSPCEIQTIPDLAYIVHTSGTTGIPKLVAVPNQCIVPNIMHIGRIFKVGSNSKVALMSPPTFDPSVVEIFITISNHATLVIPSMEVKMRPECLGQVLMFNAGVTILQATPTVLKRFSLKFLRKYMFCDSSSLRIMAFGGEACPPYVTLRSWINADSLKSRTLPNQFFNIYGITEVSSWATCQKLPADKIFDGCSLPVPLGSPLLKTELQVRCDNKNSILSIKENDTIEHFSSLPHLSDSEQPTEFTEAVSGKLFIGGCHRICHILGEEFKQYHDSGDLVEVSFLDSKPIIYFSGRADSMIKRSGKKVNLKLLTDQLTNLSDVKASQVVLVENGIQVIAFVVRDEIMHSVSDVATLVSTLTSKLWTFDVFKRVQSSINASALPDYIFQITTLPVTSHGKVDIDYLKNLYNNEIQSLSGKPNNRSEVEEILFAILPYALDEFKESNLQFCRCSLEKTFLQLGGDSFGAVVVLNWLKILLGFSIFDRISDAMDILLSCPLNLLVEKIMQVDKLCTSDTLTRKQIMNLKFQSKKRKVSGNNVVAISRGGSLNFLKDDDKLNNSLSVSDNSSPVINAKLAILWKFDTGKCVDASPLVCNLKGDRAVCYIGSHSHLFSCVDALDGKLIWNKKLPNRIESSACFCTVEDKNYVAVGCYDYNVYFFSAENGKLYWVHETAAEVKCSPSWSCKLGLMFIGSHDGYLYALHVKDKKCKWKAFCHGGSIFSSPAFFSCDKNQVNVTVAATLQGRLLCFHSETGEELWRHSVGSPLFSSPCMDESGICVGCVDCSIYFLDLEGHIIWKFSTGQPVFSSPCFTSNGGSIAIGCHDGYLYKLKKNTGSLLWKYMCDSKGSAIYSTPFSISLDFCEKNMLLYTTTSGTLCLIDDASGKELVNLKLPGELFSSAVAIHDIDAKGCRIKILTGCRDDHLYCLEATIFA